MKCDEFAHLDATAQADLIRREDVKAVEIVDATIERIERLNPILNAVVTPMYEQARAAATDKLPDGPFTGVPFLLKDLLAAFDGVPMEHLYTNATTPCPGAPHILLAFPFRFLPERKKVPEHEFPGVSDAVILSSRDGVHWDRTFMESWVRPGLDQKNWTQRSNMPAWGIVQADSDEFTMYISEHYYWPDNRLRRITIRRHGFASVNAGYGGGEFTTRPLTFSGKRLILNYATSAVGSVQVEVQDEKGSPIPGLALSDMEPLYGDELDKAIAWRDGDDLSSLIGKPVRLRFALKDADVYALRFE